MKFKTLTKTSFLTAGVALALSATSAFAAGTGTSYGAPCTTGYGGGYGASPCPQSKFTLDKQVQKPNSNDYIDNMSVSDIKYAPSAIVNFRIKVRNEGADMISSIDLTDTFPQYLTFMSGDGTYDANAKQTKLRVVDLKPGEERTVVFTTKVADANTLPNQDTVCVINQAQGTANTGMTATDNAQVCIAKSAKPSSPVVYPAPKLTQTPATGPEALVLFALGPIGAAGAFLRRKTSK